MHIQQTHLSMPPQNQSWRFFHSHICSATLYLTVEEKRATFDTERADLLVKDMRKIFKTGKTKSYEWWVLQLTGILRMIEEKEVDILRALYQDLSKAKLEAFISEV